MHYIRTLTVHFNRNICSVSLCVTLNTFIPVVWASRMTCAAHSGEPFSIKHHAHTHTQTYIQTNVVPGRSSALYRWSISSTRSGLGQTESARWFWRLRQQACRTPPPARSGTRAAPPCQSPAPNGRRRCEGDQALENNPNTRLTMAR